MKGVRVALGAAVMAGLLVSSVALGATGTPAGGKFKDLRREPRQAEVSGRGRRRDR
jgi:hypothetical protein